MTKLPDLGQVAKRLRDSVLENELCRLLRRASGEEREMFVLSLLESEKLNVRMAALSLVRRTVTDNGTLKRLLCVGLKRRDVSEIKMWFEAIGPRLGGAGILSYLATDDVEAVDIVRCWYHLMAYVKRTESQNKIHLGRKISGLMNKVERYYDQLPDDDKNYWLSFRN